MSLKHIFLFWVIGLAGTVTADDSWIGYGGTPKMMKGHPSIRMDAERVDVMIHDDYIETDCLFTFRNGGRESSVRMGFPDYDSHYDEGEDAKTHFKWFRSSVGGKRVKTAFVPAGDGTGWQVKTVLFPAHSTLHVRDRYRQELGIGMVGGGGYATHAAYILHTGAAWRGTIGRCEVVFHFMGRDAPKRMRLTVRRHSESRESRAYMSRHPNVVIWAGPTKPVIRGRRVEFVLNDWKPTSTEADDILLTFGWHGGE